MPRLNSPSPIDLSDWWKMQKLTQKLQSFMHFSVNARSWVVSTACCTRNILKDSDGGIRFQSSNDDSSQHLGNIITWTLRSQHSYLLRMETQPFFSLKSSNKKSFPEQQWWRGQCQPWHCVFTVFCVLSSVKRLQVPLQDLLCVSKLDSRPSGSQSTEHFNLACNPQSAIQPKHFLKSKTSSFTHFALANLHVHISLETLRDRSWSNHQSTLRAPQGRRRGAWGGLEATIGVRLLREVPGVWVVLGGCVELCWNCGRSFSARGWPQ